MKISFKTNFLFFCISIIFNAINSAEKESIEFTVAANKNFDQNKVNIAQNEASKLFYKLIDEEKKENLLKTSNNLRQSYIELVKSNPNISYNDFLNRILKIIDETDNKIFLNIINKIKNDYSKNLINIILTLKTKSELRKEQYDENFIMHLITLGADIKQIKNILHLAIMHNKSAKYIKFLLEHGADTNYFDRRGTPLLIALEHKNLAAIQELVKYNADVNFLNPLLYNRSPLILAMLVCKDSLQITNTAMENNQIIILQIIEKLLMAGADPNLKDIFGYSFIDYFGHNKPIADILEKVSEQRKKLITEKTGLVKEITNIIDSYL